MATFTLPAGLAPFTAPLKTFQSSYDHSARLVVGAFIFFYPRSTRSDAPDTALQVEETASLTNPPRLLLLHRASADAYGDLWDFPGGSCEESDDTLLDAVRREVYEETGLQVADVVEFVGLQTWEDKRKGQHRQWAKFCFTVTVTESNGIVPPEVKLAEAEHQAFRWVAEEEILESLRGGIDALKFISTEQIEVAAEAFKLLKSRL